MSTLDTRLIKLSSLLFFFVVLQGCGRNQTPYNGRVEKTPFSERIGLAFVNLGDIYYWWAQGFVVTDRQMTKMPHIKSMSANYYDAVGKQPNQIVMSGFSLTQTYGYYTVSARRLDGDRDIVEGPVVPVSLINAGGACPSNHVAVGMIEGEPANKIARDTCNVAPHYEKDCVGAYDRFLACQKLKDGFSLSPEYETVGFVWNFNRGAQCPANSIVSEFKYQGYAKTNTLVCRKLISGNF